MDDRWLRAWLLGAVAFGAASLLVPLYLIEQGGGAAEIGLLAAASGFGGAAGAILLGAVSDRQDGRRRIVIGGLLTVAACLAGFVAVSSPGGIIALNGIIWFVVAALTPTLTLIAIDDEPRYRWQHRIASLSRAQGVGWAAGLALGFLWMVVVPRFVPLTAAQHGFFLAMAGCAGVAAMVAGRRLPRDAGRPVAATRYRRILRFVLEESREVSGMVLFLAPARLFAVTALLRPRRAVHRVTPRLAGFFAAAFVFFTGFGMYFALLPLFLRASLGIGEEVVFGLFFLSNGAAAVAFTRAGVLADRYALSGLLGGALGLRSVLFPAVGLGGAALGAAAPGVAFLAAAFLLTGLSWAVIAVAGTTLVTTLAPDGIRGEAIGGYTALNAVAGGVGSILGGHLAADGYTDMFLAVGGLCLVAALAVVVLVRTGRSA